MRLFLPPLTIDETEGFSEQKDIFKRAEFGNRLSNVFDIVTEPLVVALDGQWGSGKSTFLKMWAGKLRNDGFPVIYFDAFENDYMDAYSAIAGEIFSLVKAKEKENTTQGAEFFKKIKGAGKVLLRSSLKLGIKVVTAGAVSGSDLGDFKEDFAEEATLLTDRYLGELLSEHENNKASISDLRAALEALPALLTEGNGKPLIFIIDELDRCKPSFALEILERIKHFFSVNNVHFILGVNFNQLTTSISTIYGSKIEDSRTYLEKFIHITFQLMDRNKHNHERTELRYIEYLIQEMALNSDDKTIINYMKHALSNHAGKNGWSLRSIERILSVFAATLAFNRGIRFTLPGVVIGLCFLKVLNSNLYIKAKQGNLNFDELDEFLKLDDSWIGNSWRYCLIDAPAQAILDEFRDDARYFNARKDIVPLIAHEVLEKFQLGR